MNVKEMIVMLVKGFWKQENVKIANHITEHNRMVESVDLIIALV